MFFQRGRVRRDSDEERAFMALSISMTTRMEREIVEAVRARSSANMLQSSAEVKVLQEWK